MQRFFARVREDRLRKRAYYLDSRPERAEKNLSLLRTLSLALCLLLPLLFLLTPLIIPGWRISVYHAGFFPVAALFSLVSLLYGRRGAPGERTVTALCLLFCCALFVFVILIDVLAAPSAPSSFMPLLCVVLPILFILPERVVYLLMLGFELVYVAGVLACKDPSLARHDVFNSVAGVLLSLPVGHVVMRLRVSDRSAQLRYRELSRRDPLTGLLNRAACQELIEGFLRRRGAVCALLILDLDDFKAKNDSRGHPAGDALLLEAGRTLSGCFRATDIIGRYGGDEFLVLVCDSADRALLEARCAAFQAELRQRTAPLGGAPLTCSIGVALCDGAPCTFSALLEAADGALYDAKARGKDGFAVRALTGKDGPA